MGLGINQLRQKCCGVKFYIWRTQNDDKVRPSHREKNGKLFAWDNNEEKPGDAYGCRCVAEPGRSDNNA
jgi:SPP1 gp7 family putative phage head morphogenesis protein